MLYIIKPAGHLTRDQAVQLRVDLEKQLSDGGSIIVLPFNCSIETLDTTPAHIPLWKRAARAFGFFRAEQLADLYARIRATEPPPPPPPKPPSGQRVCICCVDIKQKEVQS